MNKKNRKVKVNEKKRLADFVDQRKLAKFMRKSFPFVRGEGKRQG